MPSDRTLRAMNAAHRLMLRASRGRLGWTANRMPVLELTTTGRKTGEKRSTMLTSPVQVGRSYIVVASRGGDDTHPAWFLNLRDEPRVEVLLAGGEKHARIARVATPEERAELWPRVIHDHSNYAGYQERTQRQIPLVFLDPLD
jgi:deazaflavin-dependent oxidoreductase (nitroreductase family)